MKNLVQRQLKFNRQQKQATQLTVKRANITLKKKLLENQKQAINAKLSSSTMTPKELQELIKKKAKRDKQIASLTKKEASMIATQNKIQSNLNEIDTKLKEGKELAGITNIKETMTPEEKQVAEKRKQNFTNLVEKRKTAAKDEKLRKQVARDLSLSKEITRKTEQLNKLTKKQANQAAKEKNRKNTGKKLGFFEKMFNGFRKKVNISNIKRKKNEIKNLSSQIGKNSKPVVERIKLSAKKFKNFFTPKSILERQKKEAEEEAELLKALQAEA